MSQATTKKDPFRKNQDNILEKIWLQPLKYMMSIHDEPASADMRKICQSWIDVPEDKFAHAEKLIKTFYYASLLLDDVQDNSTMRGSIPVTHSVYGVPSAMNSCFYSYLHATKMVLEYHPDAILVFVQEMSTIVRGQEIEMEWEEKNICPTEEDFLDQCDQKTGCMLRIFIGLMQLYNDNKQDFSYLCRLTGIYLQVINDYKNIADEDYHKIKGFGDDITSGKYTLPIVHAAKHFPKESEEILSILRMRTKDIKLKKRLVELLDQCGSLAYTRDFMKKLRDDTEKEVTRLGGHTAPIEIMDFWARKIH